MDIKIGKGHDLIFFPRGKFIEDGRAGLAGKRLYIQPHFLFAHGERQKPLAVRGVEKHLVDLQIRFSVDGLCKFRVGYVIILRENKLCKALGIDGGVGIINIDHDLPALRFFCLLFYYIIKCGQRKDFLKKRSINYAKI